MKYTMIVVLGVLAMVSGCGLPAALSNPTPYEQKVPAEYDIAKAAQGRVAVLVQGGTASSRQLLTEALLRELQKDTDLRAKDLVPASTMEALRKDESRYLAMSQAQVGEAVGAGTVLVVKIVNYGLYPLALGSYYDGSIKVSATLMDVKTGLLLWPQNGLGREVSMNFEGEHGSTEAVTAKLVAAAAHGVVRYLYDCPKAYYHAEGELRTSEWEK
jgi:hypothetical protein